MESLDLILDGLHRIVWTIPDKYAYLSISELWAQYRDNFEYADDDFDYDIKDLTVIRADQLEGFEGKNKEEKLNDAVAKTSATFMFAVVAAIYERKKQDILQKYLQR